MTDPREVLAGIQQRADAATPGTWHRRTAPLPGESKAEWLAGTCHGDEPLQVLISESDDPRYTYLVPALTGDGPTSVANADFIAHARADVPRLVAALTAVLDLHREIPWDCSCDGCEGKTFCEHCLNLTGWHRDAPFPCESVRAITEALT